MTKPKDTRIFVSHSSKDSDFAKRLRDLFVKTIEVDRNEIMCTSVRGSGLGAGKFEGPLRKSVKASKVVVVLVSRHSLSSLFCGFEMGAAWVLDKKIMPILLPGYEISELPRPLSSFVCRTWCGDDLDLLIKDVRKRLGAERRLSKVEIAERAAAASLPKG